MPGQPVSASATKFNPILNILYTVNAKDGSFHKAKICEVGTSAMKYDPDFVKAVYLGIDLPLRYVIPCCLLVFINIALVLSVRKAQRRHSDLSNTVSTSLLNLPVLRSSVGIVFAFLICHTGGVGLFVLNVFRAFSKQNEGYVATGVNVFVEEDLATKGLEMRYTALLLASINSSINIVLYAFFLPAFRRQWKFLFVHCGERKNMATLKDPMSDEKTLDETELSSSHVSYMFQYLRLAFTSILDTGDIVMYMYKY